MLECIIQRDLGFATTDIRTSYAALLDILSDSNTKRVVLILHSQGGIEGGMALDWLYDTVSAEQLRKLEIYTFGNAANHWNAPVISSSSSGAGSRPMTTTSNGTNGDSATEQRIVQHVEHYANEGDYVSKFGILHFRPNREQPQTSGRNASIESNSAPSSKPVPTIKVPRSKSAPVDVVASKIQTKLNQKSVTWTPSPKTPIKRKDLQAAQDNNRFFGRLFKRASSGHLLNQHYLDNIFEMKNVDPEDRSKGEVKDGNEFMDGQVDLDHFIRFDTVQSIEDGEPQAERKQIKELSRLWTYRNGGSPQD